MTICDIIGKWEFNFWIERNKRTILTITPDGKANTGVTFYNCDICGDKIHLYIEDYVDYWGTFDGELISGTAESYSNVWHWSAKRHFEPIITAIPEKKLFDYRWTVINDTNELEDNEIKFQKDGQLLSNLYGTGSWEYKDVNLVITTARGFITYFIRDVDGEIEAKASNKVGQEWKITPSLVLIPKPIPKPKPLSIFKKDSIEYLNILKENSIEFLYHFTARENLKKIKELGGLYSWQYLKDHNVTIPNAGGDELSRGLDEKYGLQDYVRLSFCKDHPMSYKKRKEGSDIVVLKIALEPVIFQDTLFSDMNATDNKHNHGGGIDDLKRIHFDCTKLGFTDGMDKKYKQAEVMVKTFLPINYILNINEL